MTKKNIITLYILVVLTITANDLHSQQSDKYIIKFAPLSLIDPYGPNIHFGSEFILKDKLSIETDIAVYIPNPYRKDSTPRIKDRIGFKIKPELRYYFSYRISRENS